MQVLYNNPLTSDLVVKTKCSGKIYVSKLALYMKSSKPMTVASLNDSKRRFTEDDDAVISLLKYVYDFPTAAYLNHHNINEMIHMAKRYGYDLLTLRINDFIRAASLHLKGYLHLDIDNKRELIGARAVNICNTDIEGFKSQVEELTINEFGDLLSILNWYSKKNHTQAVEFTKLAAIIFYMIKSRLVEDILLSWIKTLSMELLPKHIVNYILRLVAIKKCPRVHSLFKSCNIQHKDHCRVPFLSCLKDEPCEDDDRQRGQDNVHNDSIPIDIHDFKPIEHVTTKAVAESHKTKAVVKPVDVDKKRKTPYMSIYV